MFPVPLLFYYFPTTVITLLSLGNDTCPFLFLIDWEIRPEGKELTGEQDASEEKSAPKVLIENFLKEGDSRCEDSLESQQEKHEKNLIQEVVTQKKSGE